MPGASVLVERQNSGPSQTVQTDGEGRYRITGLTAGQYKVTAKAAGFQTAVEQTAISGARHIVTLDIQLVIAAQSQQVFVQGTAPRIEVSPDSNASAVAVSGSNLNALSNDPDELQNQISSLAGPSVGASGAEIYVNGLTGSDMPPSRRFAKSGSTRTHSRRKTTASGTGGLIFSPSPGLRPSMETFRANTTTPS